MMKQQLAFSGFNGFGQFNNNDSLANDQFKGINMCIITILYDFFRNSTYIIS